MKHNDTVLRFVHYNGNFVKIWEHDGSQVFFSGAEVTYVVDGAEYKEFVNYGQSCLSPTVVTPTKSGWEFAGWRKDTVASGSVEHSVVMNTEPITLYAVFKKEVTLSAVSYSSLSSRYTTKTAKGTAYYNNSNVEGARVTCPTGDTYSGWTWRGWSNFGATTATETPWFANGAKLNIGTDNKTVYGLYLKEITVTYYNNSTTASTAKDTRYFNASGVMTDAEFYLPQAVKSGWAERGWSLTNAGNATAYVGNAVVFKSESNITLYGMYQQNVRVTTVANGSSSYKDGTRYWAPAGYINPTFTVSNPSKSGATFQGWSATAGSTSIAMGTISGLTINNAYTSMTYYAVFKYSDAAMADKRINRDDAFLPADAESNGIYVTLASSVDFSKYYAATIKFGEQYTGSLTLNQNFTGSTVKLLAKCGSDSVVLYSDYINAYSAHETTARSGTKTLNFTKTSGSAPLIVTPGGDGHCDNCYVNASGTLHGRTVVG
jgi:uncharacterized repeat protein (TIGR02543 family)